MKTILLAIDDKGLDAKVFEFALKLCRRLGAALDILHIVRPIGKSGLQKLASKLRRTRNVLENTMAAATFAEAGMPETARAICREAEETVDRLTPPDTDAPVAYRSLYTAEGSGEVLSRYIGEHRNVVLTVYDYSETAAGKDTKRTPGCGRPSVPLPDHPTPVVLVNLKNNKKKGIENGRSF